MKMLGFAAGTMLLIASGIGMAQQVHSNYMPGTNFAKYKTYKWVAISGSQQLNQIQDAEIKQAVDAQLSAKGFTKTTDDNASMYVGFQPSVDQEREWNAYGMGGGWRWGGGMGTATSSTIAVGTLGLDFYDPATKTLIWRGEATETLNPSGNQQKNQKKLDKAMQKLLKNFPPT
jgi:hypothetical protein